MDHFKSGESVRGPGGGEEEEEEETAGKNPGESAGESREEK